MSFTNILYIIHYILYRYILMRVIKAEMSALPAGVDQYLYKDHKLSL